MRLVSMVYAAGVGALVLCGCAGNSKRATDETSVDAKVKASAVATTGAAEKGEGESAAAEAGAGEGETGYVLVKTWRGDWFSVLDGDGKTVLNKKSNRAWEVPCGTYTVECTPGEKFKERFESIAVRAGDTATVRAEGYGAYKADAMNRWGTKAYNADGKEVNAHLTGLDIMLPVGTYTVKVFPEGRDRKFQTVVFENVEIKDREVTKLAVKGFGNLVVKYPERKDVSVYDGETKVTGYLTNKKFVVPAGVYTVKVGGIVKEDVRVDDRQTTTVALE